MDNNFENVDLDSDIVLSEWDSCGSNKSDDEWEYVEDKRVDTARGRGATRTSPINWKNDQPAATIPPEPIYSDHENDLLTQEHFFDRRFPRHQGWNSTEREHSTTNQPAFAEKVDDNEYHQFLIPAGQSRDSTEREHLLQPGESTGEWWDQVLQGTSASDVQSRLSRISASSQYPPEEPSTQPQATTHLPDRNHEPQNQGQFGQRFDESFGQLAQGEHLPDMPATHPRHRSSSGHPPETSVPSRPSQTDVGSGSGKENVPPKRIERSRGRPATRRGYRPEYLDREWSRDTRHPAGPTAQETRPYGMQDHMGALPKAPTTEAENPRPSEDAREQKAPPTPRLVLQVRPDTSPGRSLFELLTSHEFSTSDDSWHAYSSHACSSSGSRPRQKQADPKTPVKWRIKEQEKMERARAKQQQQQQQQPHPQQTPDDPQTAADVQRTVEEQDRERARMHRRRARRYPRALVPTTAVDTTPASGSSESQRVARSSDTTLAEERLAPQARKPFSYQKMK